MPSSMHIGNSSFDKTAANKTVKERANVLDPSEAEGDCPICMDKFNQPRKLEKCGHIFCSECIEAYFEYKPTCPTCGAIYGKVTGDQPHGFIKFDRDYRSHLPGYERYGSIKVTYTFPDGKQGVGVMLIITFVNMASMQDN